MKHFHNEVTEISERVRKAKNILAENADNNGWGHVKCSEH